MRSKINLSGAVSNIVRVGEIAGRGAAATGAMAAGLGAALATGPFTSDSKPKLGSGTFNWGVDQGNKAVSQFKGMFH